MSRVLVLVLTASVLGAIAAGLLVVGGPDRARLERLDERRLRDLDLLARRIESFRLDRGRLPEDLQALLPGLARDVAIRDPETGEPYAYTALGEGFRLCATLSLPDTELARRPVTDLPGRDRVLARTTTDGLHCLEARAPDG